MPQKKYPTTIVKIAAMVFENNSFLMVRKKGKTIWTSLGGKIEKDETEEQALLREIKEELNCDATILYKLGDFQDKAVFDDAMLHLSVYVVKLIGEPTISDDELEEFTYVGKDYAEKGIQLTDIITKQIIPLCKSKGLLKW